MEPQATEIFLGGGGIVKETRVPCPYFFRADTHFCLVPGKTSQYHFSILITSFIAHLILSSYSARLSVLLTVYMYTCFVSVEHNKLERKCQPNQYKVVIVYIVL